MPDGNHYLNIFLRIHINNVILIYNLIYILFCSLSCNLFCFNHILLASGRAVGFRKLHGKERKTEDPTINDEFWRVSFVVLFFFIAI